MKGKARSWAAHSAGQSKAEQGRAGEAKKDLPTAPGGPAVLGDPKSRRCLSPRELQAVEVEG